MVKERRELHLPISMCYSTYPLKLVWHANPALRPEHGVLVRIALGQPSSLHRLRWLLMGRSLLSRDSWWAWIRLIMAVVRRLRRYYTAVRLPVFVHHEITSLDFPMRPVAPLLTGEHGISRFSREVVLCMQRFFDRARSPSLLPGRAMGCGLPRAETASAPRTLLISRLNSSPAHAPVNASRPSLRATAHDSGSV